MPTIRKRINVGIPNLKDVLLAIILMNSRIDPNNRIFSADKLIVSGKLKKEWKNEKRELVIHAAGKKMKIATNPGTGFQAKHFLTRR